MSAAQPHAKGMFLAEWLVAVIFVGAYAAVQIHVFHYDAILSSVVSAVALILSGVVFWWWSKRASCLMPVRWLVLLCCLALGCGASNISGILLYNSITTYRAGTTRSFGEYTMYGEKEYKRYYGYAFKNLDAYLLSQGFSVEVTSDTKRLYHGTYEDSLPFDVEVVFYRDSRDPGISADVIWKVRGFRSAVDSSVAKFDKFTKQLNSWWTNYSFSKEPMATSHYL